MAQISEGIFSRKFKNQLLATLCANILSLTHGIMVGWYVPTQYLLQSDETPLNSGKIDVNEISWIGSLMMIGAMAGNIFFGFLINKVGRKKTLLLLGIPNVSSWLLVIFGNNVYHIYIARVLAGATGGGVFVVFPIFVAEIADNSIRGTLSSFVMLMFNFGVLVGYILGSYVPYRVFPMVIIAGPVVYTLAMTYFAETPQYLLESGKSIEAEDSYKFYRNVKEIAKEDLQKLNEDFTNLKLSIRGNGYSKDDDKITVKDFCTPAAQKGMIIGFCLIGLNQMSGAFSIVSYTSNIFADLKIDVNINLNTIIIGVVQALGTYVSTVLVDRVGRKVLLIVSVLTTALGLAGISLYAYFSKIFDLSYMSWVPVTCLSFAIFAACIGIISLPYVVMTEVVPLKIRSIVSTGLVITLNLQCFAVMKVYPLLIESLGVAGVMCISCISCIFGAVFIFTYIPETKGKSLTN